MVTIVTAVTVVTVVTVVTNVKIMAKVTLVYVSDYSYYC